MGLAVESKQVFDVMEVAKGSSPRPVRVSRTLSEGRGKMATVAESPVKKRLSDIVGSQAVSDKPDVLQSFAGGSGSVPRGEPIATVRPRNRNEVQAIVRLANELGINLVAASSGPPRFRGGTVPCEAGVIVDLSAMDKIVRIDRLNMVAIIEPGVTFAWFKAEAEKQQLRVFMPLLPRSTKSALASYLEREPITVPKYHWDMSDPMLTAEIVFGEGDLFRTGSAAGPGSLEDQWKMGLARSPRCRHGAGRGQRHIPFKPPDLTR